MADLQSGGGACFAREWQRFRGSDHYSDHYRSSRPGSRSGGEGMVEPAARSPGRHPRDGRGESLSPGAAQECGARQHINPAVSCRVCAPEIRRDFSHRGAVGISATSPERNHMVPLYIRVAENGNPGGGVEDGKQTSGRPHVPSARVSGGYEGVGSAIKQTGCR
jgi:hypothetical protein